MINLDGAVFWSGLTFLDTETVMPLLLTQLGASNALVGMSRLIQVLGYTLPALIAAHYIHGRKFHKRFMLMTLGIQRLVVLALPFGIYFYAKTNPTLALYIIFFVMSCFWLLDGGAAVSWFDLVAKTVPSKVRGRFFGVMQTLGGGAAFAGGFAVSAILRNPNLPYPTNFALLALLFFVFMLFSQFFLTLIHEPEGIVDESPKPGFIDFLKQAVPLLKRRPRLANLIGAQLLLDSATMASPFYVLFAQRDLGVTLGLVGTFAIAKQFGKMVFGPIWGYISDHRSPAAAFFCVSICIFLVPILALSARYIGVWVMVPAFLLLGGVQDGVWMTGSNVMLESILEEERPLAVGVSSILRAPSAIYGVLGGLLATWFTYEKVFFATMLTIAIGLAMVLRLSTSSKPWKPEIADAVS